VSMSMSFVGHDDPKRMFEQHRLLFRHYTEMFRFPSRNSFFVENILEPLSHDLKYGEYSGYRFNGVNLSQFFREFTNFCNRRLYGHILHSALRFKIEEIFLVNYYAQTFLLVHNGNLREAYSEMYRYRAPLSILENYPLLLPSRPYYFYSDEDRYLWFSFLQAELRSAEHDDFADVVLETEIEHFRELINWQLQLRAYLAQKLYEYGDNSNLATLKELLAEEYAELKNGPLLQTNFEIAIGILCDMDETNGNLVLPWIDREAIDYKQGIRSRILSIYPESITWKRAMESIDDETIEEMRNLYERAIYCIRVLALINERLYLEKDLETMVQLHSRLANNRKVSYMPTCRAYFLQNFVSLRNTYGDGEIFPELDLQTRLNLRGNAFIANDFWVHQFKPNNAHMDVNYMPTGFFHQNLSILKNTYGDGRDFPDLDAQTRFDLRRHDLIANDFWGHQARRGNGDMTVGDIILPWVGVRVWDEVP